VVGVAKRLLREGQGKENVREEQPGTRTDERTSQVLTGASTFFCEEGRFFKRVAWDYSSSSSSFWLSGLLVERLKGARMRGDSWG
jgi:hypothetical protein